MKYGSKLHAIYWDKAKRTSEWWSYYTLHEANEILIKNDKNLKANEAQFDKVEQTFKELGYPPEKFEQWKRLIYAEHEATKVHVAEERQRLNQQMHQGFLELNDFRETEGLKSLISLGFSASYDFTRTDLP